MFGKAKIKNSTVNANLIRRFMQLRSEVL